MIFFADILSHSFNLQIAKINLCGLAEYSRERSDTFKV